VPKRPSSRSILYPAKVCPRSTAWADKTNLRQANRPLQFKNRRLLAVTTVVMVLTVISRPDGLCYVGMGDGRTVRGGIGRRRSFKSGTFAYNGLLGVDIPAATLGI
jgi:hypothetical protein